MDLQVFFWNISDHESKNYNYMINHYKKKKILKQDKCYYSLLPEHLRRYFIENSTDYRMNNTAIQDFSKRTTMEIKYQATTKQKSVFSVNFTRKI